MDGILLLYKQDDITSSNIVEKISKNFSIKCGHTGTLDRAAEGLLILTLGKATRFTQYFQHLGKQYLARGKLGIVTDTYDRNGRVITTSDFIPTDKQIKEAILSFIGKSEQIPPSYSSKWVNGERAYRLAKKGENFKLKPKVVEISNIEILDIAYPYFEIKVDCSSGTYIRSLIKDIGDKLSSGAYMSYLKRTKIGDFDISKSYKLDDILSMNKDQFEKLLISPSDALYFFKPLLLDDENIDRFKKGQKVKIPDQLKDFRYFPSQIFSDNYFDDSKHIKNGNENCSADNFNEISSIRGSYYDKSNTYESKNDRSYDNELSDGGFYRTGDDIFKVIDKKGNFIGLASFLDTYIIKPELVY